MGSRYEFQFNRYNFRSTMVKGKELAKAGGTGNSALGAILGCGNVEGLGFGEQLRM